MPDLDRITTNPAILGGKPCIRGMRLSVERVLDIAATYGSWDEIHDAFPYLEPEDIRQALHFASLYIPGGERALDKAS